MERKNRLKNVAPDDKAAKAVLNGRLMDGDFAAWKAKTVTTVQSLYKFQRLSIKPIESALSDKAD
jgi:hypothetical protein